MTDESKYRTLLMAKREEIAGKLPRREDLWIVQSNEQTETVQLAGQREFTARILERETKSLTQIGAALKRIDDGEFGICLECEEPIAPKRLAARRAVGCLLFGIARKTATLRTPDRPSTQTSPHESRRQAESRSVAPRPGSGRSITPPSLSHRSHPR